MVRIIWHSVLAQTLLIASLLTGCAVLKIDVDVYKGPLMNQDEVQIEETAVLAIATKPLLHMLVSEVEKTPSDLDIKMQLEGILCLYGSKPKEQNECDKTNLAGDTPLEEAFQQYITNEDPQKIEQNKNLLLGRLTRFAERVRILGNFSILAVSAEKNVNSPRPNVEALDYFVRVLQAVGNTILFQVDAIRATHGWNKMIEDRLQQESAAVAGSEYANVLKARTQGKGELKTSLQVLDLIVSTLQYRYIHAVETNGSSKDAIGNALKEAYAYRANLVFLRSSAAYLRTSYPATTLQKEANSANRLLLKEAMYRGISLGLYGGSYEKERVANEMDKQYWQNINQIKLVGGGNTNYAVVKDDTGNWYVKSYSANYEDIIKNITNLATGVMTLGAPLPVK